MPMLTPLPGQPDKYLPFAIQRYRLWTLYLHADQRYLGRAYLWLRRPGTMQRLTDLEDEELQHLALLTKKYEVALQTLWRPDHINYAWLGNEVHVHGGHGHMHLVPRYKHPRDFAGLNFVERNWGKNYAPYQKYTPDRFLMERIRDAIQEKLA